MNTTTHAPQLASAAAYDLTAGRGLTLVAALAAVVGLALAVRALRSSDRRGSSSAMAAGAAALLVGTWVVVTADGGPGSGSGVVGGYVAIGLGALTVALGARAHRARGSAP
jgi:hypothetical protein